MDRRDVDNEYDSLKQKVSFNLKRFNLIIMEMALSYFDKGGLIFLALGILSIFSITIIIYKFLDIYFFNDINLRKIFKGSDDIHTLEDIENLIAGQSGKNNIILNDTKTFYRVLSKIPKKKMRFIFI